MSIHERNPKLTEVDRKKGHKIQLLASMMHLGNTDSHLGLQ